MEPKEDLIKKISFLLRKNHINYEETKYIFRKVRENLDLKYALPKKKLPKFLTYGEVQNLIKTGYQTKALYGLIIKFLFVTGIRVSELVNLKLEDLFLEDNKIKIVQGKCKKDRIVLIDNSLKNEILLYLGNRKRGYLFKSNRHSKFTSRTIQIIVNEIGIASKINKRVTPHILRHSFATYLLNKGLRLDQVQLLLGHTNPRTTEIYAKTSLQLVQEDFSKIMNGKF